ncbi:MAG: putative C-S lyase [Bacteroidales bacterium]|nr:putative C-S lyase [Bacteroidales bacterium]
MHYDFNKSINRWGTDCVKYDSLDIMKGDSDIIPMWVADMDFQTPAPILNSIREKLDHGVLGYTLIPEDWYASIIRWLNKRYDWVVHKEEIIFTPGIVRGLAFVIQCFTQPSDSIMIMSPVYPPFFNVPLKNKRKVVYHSLKLEDGEIEIDFEQFRKDIQGCKLLILCNPHNPGGRVWTSEELALIAEICAENKVLVLSDEIHADLTLPGNEHTPYFKSSPLAKEHGIVFMSPSKAFNMAGLSSSYGIIQNESLLKQYKEFVTALDVDTGGMFAYRTLVAAYNECEEWLSQLVFYLEENINMLLSFLEREMPKIRFIRPQASFLVFLDCRDLQLSDSALNAFFKEAGLILNPGVSYGKEASGFMRMNLGCTKKTLLEALGRLKKVYDAHFVNVHSRV